MKNKSLWSLAGFALTSLFGTILHFLYDWTGENTFAAIFSGVNESTWEHMKLLFFPLFFFALIQSRFFKNYNNFWCVKLWGTAAGLLSIPIIFYTLSGTFGALPDYINISIFFVSAGITFLLENKLFQRKNTNCKARLAFGLLLLIGCLFILFTFQTPKIPLFEDPLTGTFGI